MLEIAATEYYRKGAVIRFVSWKVDSVTAFGDHRVEFDLPRQHVIRQTEGRSEMIARIRSGYEGTGLQEFFGTVESGACIITKRKTGWPAGIGGNVIFEVTLKDCGTSLTIPVMRYDLHNSFKIRDILNLRLVHEDLSSGCSLRVEGTCAAAHQDLGEIIACLLLHHSVE